MSETALNRLPGMALVLSADGAISAWEKISVSGTIGVFTPTAADSEYVQKVVGQKDGKGSLDIFKGAEAPVFTLGQEIEVISVKEGANTIAGVLDELGTFGKCRVTGISEEYQAEPGKGKVDFEFGFID